MKRRLAFSFLLIVATLCVSADAADWAVETGDFRTHVGSLQKLNADTLELRTVDGDIESLHVRDVLRIRPQNPGESHGAPDNFGEIEVSLNQVLSINGTLMTVASTNANITQLAAPDGQQKPWLTSVVRQIIQSNAARSHHGTLMLELNNGDSFVGRPTGVDGTSLSWSNSLFGELRLPLERLQRMVRVPEKVGPPIALSADDTVLLGNGDIVHGIVSNVSSSSLKLQTSGGTETDIPLDSLQQLCFAQTTQPPARPTQGFELQLNDGTRVTVRALRLDADQWSATRFDEVSNHFPMDSLLEIEHIGGPVTWLSDLRPSDGVHRSYTGREWPTQFDHSVEGGPLQFESRRFRHGIGVHSYSRLTFEVPSGFDRLHLSYAIDGNAPYADVDVRVLLDDKVVLDSPHFRAGTLATPPAIALAGAGKITLEVDFGDNQDVQDRFNWIEPALLRSAGK